MPVLGMGGRTCDTFKGRRGLCTCKSRRPWFLLFGQQHSLAASQLPGQDSESLQFMSRYYWQDSPLWNECLSNHFIIILAFACMSLARSSETQVLLIWGALTLTCFVVLWKAPLYPVPFSQTSALNLSLIFFMKLWCVGNCMWVCELWQNKP